MPETPERAVFCSILSLLSGRPVEECEHLPDDVELNDLYDPEIVAQAERLSEQVIREAKSADP